MGRKRLTAEQLRARGSWLAAERVEQEQEQPAGDDDILPVDHPEAVWCQVVTFLQSKPDGDTMRAMAVKAGLPERVLYKQTEGARDMTLSELSQLCAAYRIELRRVPVEVSPRLMVFDGAGRFREYPPPAAAEDTDLTPPEPESSSLGCNL